MKTITLILLIFAIWFASTQLGINWPRIMIASPGTSQNPNSQPEQWRQLISEPSIEEIEKLVLDKINDRRIENNREPIEWSQHLAQKAREHSTWMADTSEYQHSTYNCYENCFWGVSISSYRLADTIVNTWMESKGHKANLLEAEITKCGIGIAFNPTTNSHYATFMAY